jgi:hypothetical protein
MFYSSNCLDKGKGDSVSALITLTPSESRRLIAKAVAILPEVKYALEKGLVVIARGSTNAFVAEEIMGISIEDKADEYCRGFIVDGELHANRKRHTERSIGYDFVLRRGKLEEVDFQEVMQEFTTTDVFIKGANAVDSTGEAGVLAAGTAAGTIGKALPAVIFAAAHLIVPVGLEKLVPSVSTASRNCGALNFKYSTGLPCTLVPIINAEVVTEIQAFEILAGVNATHVASGGIGGSEGTVVLSLEGSDSSIEQAFALVKTVKGEPPVKRPSVTTPPAASMNYDPVALRDAI